MCYSQSVPVAGYGPLASDVLCLQNTTCTLSIKKEHGQFQAGTKINSHQAANVSKNWLLQLTLLGTATLINGLNLIQSEDKNSCHERPQWEKTIFLGSVLFFS